MIRLDKYLSEAGIGSRSQVKEMIRKGQISVSGLTDIKPETKIDPETDSVCLNGEPINHSKYVYYLLNKPAGCVSATSDAKDKTVLDLISGNTRKDLFPVGRLDKDTEGLLLITNDGELAHRLLSPKKHVEKEYYAKTDHPIPSDAVEKFSNGIDIGEEKPTLPAKLTILSETSANVILCEGKFHQVKRMFHAVGCEVTYLKRIRMGNLVLDERLKLGEYRELTEEEIASLRNYQS